MEAQEVNLEYIYVQEDIPLTSNLVACTHRHVHVGTCLMHVHEDVFKPLLHPGYYINFYTNSQSMHKSLAKVGVYLMQHILMQHIPTIDHAIVKFHTGHAI